MYLFVFIADNNAKKTDVEVGDWFSYTPYSLMWHPMENQQVEKRRYKKYNNCTVELQRDDTMGTWIPKRAIAKLPVNCIHYTRLRSFRCWPQNHFVDQFENKYNSPFALYHIFYMTISTDDLTIEEIWLANSIIRKWYIKTSPEAFNLYFCNLLSLPVQH